MEIWLNKLLKPILPQKIKMLSKIFLFLNSQVYQIPGKIRKSTKSTTQEKGDWGNKTNNYSSHFYLLSRRPMLIQTNLSFNFEDHAG